MITTIEELQKYINENYDYTPMMNFYKYCYEDGKFNLYSRNNETYYLSDSYDTCRELMSRLIDLKLCVPKNNAAQPFGLFFFG